MTRRVRMTWGEAKQWVRDNPHKHHHVVEFTSCLNKQVYTQEKPLVTASWGTHNKRNKFGCDYPGWCGVYVVYDEKNRVALTTKSDTLVLEIPGGRIRKRKQ